MRGSQAASELGVTDYPTLVVLPADGGSAIAYAGELKPDALTSFLEAHAAPAPEASADADADAGNFVIEVSAGNVASAVEGERGAWLLVFAGSDSADLSSEGGVAALAETLHGQVKVGRASSDLAAKFGVTLGSAPVVAMWPFRKAGVARKASAYAGDEAGVAAAKKAALETLTDEGVTPINQMTMDRCAVALLDRYMRTRAGFVRSSQLTSPSPRVCTCARARACSQLDAGVFDD